MQFYHRHYVEVSGQLQETAALHPGEASIDSGCPAKYIITNIQAMLYVDGPFLSLSFLCY